MTIAQTIFWASLAALAYVYAGYPMLVWLVAKLRGRKTERRSIEPKVTILITAFNEERAIGDKLRNTLDIEYPSHLLEILVASDGSTDRTDEIVESFDDPRVRLFHQPGRVGKTATQNAAVELATGDVIVFSDATTRYPSDILRRILPAFADEGVGCVAGRLVYADESGSDIGKGAQRYWSYETFLKECESSACSLIGASGCLYAIRRSAYRPMYPEACSDFLICTVLYEQGYRSVFEPSAVCIEETNRESSNEFRMRVRVIAQTFTDLWRNRSMMNPLKSGFYAIQLLSHKVLRYAAPLFMLAAFVSSVLGAVEGSVLMFAAAAGQALFYLSALTAWMLERAGVKTSPLAIPLYFVLANAAAVAGFVKFLRGERYASWQPIRDEAATDRADPGLNRFDSREESLAGTDEILSRLTLVERGSDVAESPRVSVVVPAFKSSATVCETLDSVFGQSFESYEVVVVNDGSPDSEELRRALGRYAHHIVYAEQPNLGAASARNAGIALARGELVAFLDADDLWFPEYLESQVAELDSRGLDMVYCDAELFGEELFRGGVFSDTAPSSGAVTSVSLLDSTCNVITSGTVVRKEVFEDCGLFDAALSRTEDFDMWFRIVRSGASVGYQTRVLLKYRIAVSGLSGSALERAERNLDSLEAVGDKHLLTDGERAAINASGRLLRAEVHLARGKQLLAQRRSREAAEAIEDANRILGKSKLSFVVILLRLFPSCAPLVFRLLRPSEYSFIVAGEAHTEPTLKAQSVWLMSAKFVTFVLSFVLPLLVVRFLDQSSVGTYRQAFQFITNSLIVLPLGFGMSAYYYLATETSRRASAVFHILILNAFVGTVAYLTMTLFPGIIGGIFNNPELRGLSSLIGAVVCMWTVSTFLEVVAVANREPRTATMLIILAQLTKTVLMVSAVVWFSSVEAFLIAALAQGGLQTLALLFYLHSRFPRFWTAFDARFFIEQLKYALPLGLAGLLWTLQTDVHFYFVGSQFSPAEFAVYAYGCFQLPLVWMLAESINSVLIPRMSGLAKDGDRSEIIRLLGRSSHKLALAYMPLAAFLAVMADTFVVTMFTESYRAAVPIFLTNLVLLPFYVFSLDAVTRAFSDLGRKLLALRVVLSVSLIAVLFAEGRSFGLEGIILTVVLVLVFERLVMVGFTARRLRFSRADLVHFTPLLKTLAAAVVAGVVTAVFNMFAGEAAVSAGRAAAERVLGTESGEWAAFAGGVFALAAGGTVFGIVYLAGILRANLIDEEEKSTVSKALSGLGLPVRRKTRKPEVTA